MGDSLYTLGSYGTKLKPGEGLVGAVYDSQENMFISNVTELGGDVFIRKELALEYDIKSLAMKPWRKGVLEIGSTELEPKCLAVLGQPILKLVCGANKQPSQPMHIDFEVHPELLDRA